MNARRASIDVLHQVLAERRSLATAVESLRALSPPQRALAQEICFGVMRWWWPLDAALRALLGKPLKAKDHDIYCLLLGGIYQLWHMRTPPHVAVNECVETALALKKEWAKGLVNAVLRNALRQQQSLQADLEKDDETRYAHPRWLIDALRAAWPAQWQSLIEANNARANMCLRVNTARASRDDYLRKLSRAGIAAQATAFSPVGIALDAPCDVRALPDFDKGEVSVQDEAAQMAAFILSADNSSRVLDACAAPGGKTAHMLEMAPGAAVVALDKSPARLRKIDETLARIGARARTVAADAADTKAWWDGQPFSHILLDAPCSATGVIRRNPDIKFLRRADDIGALAAEQRRLLEALWPLLQRGGRLLYATCSVLPPENAHGITGFLQNRRDARLLPLRAPWALDTGAGHQVLTGARGMDGFFYALLEKTGE